MPVARLSLQQFCTFILLNSIDFTFTFS